MDARIILALVAVVGGGAIAAAGAMPQAHLTPTQALQEGIPGETVTIKGTVTSLDASGQGPFTLTDGHNEITIHWDRPYPQGFGTNRTVAVDGTLQATQQGTALDGERLQMGCPSKYQAV